MLMSLSFKEVFVITLGDPSFQISLGFGLITFYCIKQGCYLLYVDKVNNFRKIPLVEFGGYGMSLIHSVMISIMALIVLFNYNETTVCDIKSYNFIISSYKIVTTQSIAYFIMDIFDILLYYKHKNYVYKISFIIHHSLCILTQCSVFKSHPYVTWIAASGMLIEISTIALNIRMFGKIFNNNLLFKFGGISALISYPATRIIFCIYLLYTTYYSKLDYYLNWEFKFLLLTTFAFILTLSSTYYFFVMLKKPKSMYILSPKYNRNYPITSPLPKEPIIVE